MISSTKNTQNADNHDNRHDIENAAAFLFNYLDESIIRVKSLNISSTKLLRARLAIQLHKYTIDELRLSFQPAIIETEKISAKLGLLNHSLSDVLSLPETHANYFLNDTVLREVDNELAFYVHTHSHYLLSPRIGIFHLALYAKDGSMLGLATYSKFDLNHLKSLFSNEINNSNIVVLSRLIVFDNAPPNTSTFLLARTREWIKYYFPDIRLCISYLDPNVGFRGTTYLAFNAVLLAQEMKSRYLYNNGEYITDRELILQYGTANADLLFQMGLRNISESQMPLMPLCIFCWQIQSPLRNSFFDHLPRLIKPSEKLTG